MPVSHVELPLIRQVFDQVQQRLSVSSTVARLLAVLELDLCVELALSLVLRHGTLLLQPPKRSVRQDIPRRELWQDADALFANSSGVGLPHATELRTLHELRNLAQHAGTIPSTEAIQRAIAPVREFLGLVYLKLFDLDFNRFCMWHLVSCVPLRTLFEDVAEALRLSLPTIAIAGCRQAYRRVAGALEHVAEGFVAVRRFGPLHEEPGDRAIREITNELATTVNSMRVMLIAAGVGVGVEETLRFERSGAGLGADELVGGHLHLAILRTHEPERLLEDAEFMFSYVVRLTLLFEQTYPQIFDPVTIPLRLRDQPLWKEVAEK